MRSLKYIATTLFLVTVMLVAAAFINIKKSPATDNGKGFAVIELFTSEGCSSCPPADAVVAKIQKESEGKPIYILAFHVDYWNRLGWTDAFSSADYSKRQEQYAAWLHSTDGIYTPQIVVNGKTEFVGSEEGTLRSVIKTNLQKDAAAQVSLSDIQSDGQKIKLRYQTQGNINNTILQLAFIQKSAQTKVESGENGGRTLSHVQIVRALQSVPLKNAEGTASITVPKEVNMHGAELIAFLQDTSNGVVTGATKADL
jgi:hypothetical protein